MKTYRFQSLAATVSCIGMLLSPVATAAPVGQPSAPADVALSADGVLIGQVVNAQGAALQQAPVSIAQDGHEVIRVVTDAKGEFAVRGLRGGVYQIITPGRQGSYRIWAPRTAPPAASNGLLAVAGDSAVLGQYGPAAAGGPMGAVTGWIAAHPLMTAGIIATAIAVPLAIDDDDSAS